MSKLKTAFVTAGVVLSQLTGEETPGTAAVKSAQAYDALKAHTQEKIAVIKKKIGG